MEYNTSIIQSTRRPRFDYLIPAPSRQFGRFYFKVSISLQTHTVLYMQTVQRQPFPHCFHYIRIIFTVLSSNFLLIHLLSKFVQQKTAFLLLFLCWLYSYKMKIYSRISLCDHRSQWLSNAQSFYEYNTRTWHDLYLITILVFLWFTCLIRLCISIMMLNKIENVT